MPSLMFRNATLATFLLCLNVLHIKGQIADALPGCLPIVETAFYSNGALNCNNSTSWEFGVSGTDFVVRAMGGAACCPGGSNSSDHESFFRFETLDISCLTDVQISMEYQGVLTGGQTYEDDSPTPLFGCQGGIIDNSHDQIVFTYSLDGGPEIQSLYVHGTTEADFTGTWTEGPLNGNTLSIKIYASNKAAGEAFRFRNLSVTASPSILSAGADQMVCNGDVVSLGGSGSGTWTGGSGSFDNTMDPTTNYNPAAGEANSTITLTYSCEAAVPACANNYPGSSDEVDITFSSPTANMEYANAGFNGQFCSGDCETIDVMISGGTPPYTLSMQFSAGPINFPFPIPGFDINDQIILCYDSDAILPNFDPSTNTITVPGLANGASGQLTLVSIADGSCSTTVNDAVPASFQTSPELDPAVLTLCDEGFGFATFNLDDALTQLNPTGGATVTFYQQMNMTLQITGPYSSGGETVWAFAELNGCISDPTPVNLIMLPLGNVGFVDFTCDGTNTNCTLCDTDGGGVDINLPLILASAGSTYEVTIDVVPGGEQTFTVSGGTTNLPFTVSGLTTFTITAISENGLCPDETDLGTTLTVTVVTPPNFDDPGPLSSCTGLGVTLPPITGINIPSNAAYYTQSGGMGTTLMPGQMVNTSQTLYLYGGVPGCDDEVTVEVTVGAGTTYDPVSNVSTCQPYVLPPITGTGVGSGVGYYTVAGGGGMRFEVGAVITTDITLFIFDPSATCATNEPFFSIRFDGAVTLDPIADTIVCEQWIFPLILANSGMLSGDQAYYSMSSAEGIMYVPGDTITFDSIIAQFDTNVVTFYVYDSTMSCIVEDTFQLTIERQRFAGTSDTLAYCQGTTQLLDLNMIIGGIADTNGFWSPTIPDSTMLNISGLPIGFEEWRYNVPADTVCRDTFSTVRLQITAGEFAGNGSTLTLCQGDLNPRDVIALLGNPSILGRLETNPNGIGIDLTNPNAVVLGNASIDMFELLHITSGAGGCPPDTAILDVNLTADINAGIDRMTNTCSGTAVNLANVLQGNTTVGTFRDLGFTGNLVGAIFSTSGLSGTYLFEHIVSNPICGSDTALITVVVSTSTTAGNDVVFEVCDPSQEFNLTTILDSGDSGGTFYQGALPVPDAIFPVDFGDGAIYQYIVGDGVTCAFDTAEIRLDFVPFDLSVFTSIQAICPRRSQFASIITDIDREYNIYFTTRNANTGARSTFERVLEVSDTLVVQFRNLVDGIEDGVNLEPDQSYIITIDSVVSLDGCVLALNESFTVRTVNELQIDVDTTLCRGDTLRIFGREFTESFLFVGTTNFGCDSIIDVRIDYFDQDTNFVVQTLCESQTIDIGGTTFSNMNPSGTINLPAGSTNGCDSVIVVDLTFTDGTMINITDTICGSETITIGGQTFDGSNPTGMVMLSGQNGECDTTININLTISQPATNEIRQTLCSGTTITVGGQVFSETNPSGIINLMGAAASGCDSVITVVLSFGSETIINVNDPICSGDTLVVAGSAFFVGSSIGTINIPGSNGDCDTIYQVALVEVRQSRGNELITACDPTETFVRGSLILDIDNPTGSYLAGTNQFGCDSIVDVEVQYGSLELQIDYLLPICDDDLPSVVLNYSGSALPLLVSVDGDQVSVDNFPFTIALASYDVSLLIEDNQGCATRIDSTLQPLSTGVTLTTVDVDGGTQIIVNSTVDPTDIIWIPAEGLSCTDCLDPIASPALTTTYTVALTFEDRCVETFDILIPVSSGGLIIFPNIISPNGNPQNQIFYVKAREGHVVETMRIYDRWGGLLFADDNIPVNDPSRGWNGRVNGREVTPGVYAFMVVIRNPAGGTFRRRGTVTVIR